MGPVRLRLRPIDVMRLEVRSAVALESRFAWVPRPRRGLRGFRPGRPGWRERVERWLLACEGLGLLWIPLCAAACRAPAHPAPVPPGPPSPVQPAAKSAVQPVLWDGLTGAPKSADGLPIQVSFEGDLIVAVNGEPQREARFLTFERGAAGSAYGVYALHSAKARMEVPAPLRGEPIAWPDLDPAAAMVRLLTYAGVAPDAAHALVETHGQGWFSAGLRVLVVVPPASPGALGTLPESGATVWIYAHPEPSHADRESQGSSRHAP